MKKQTLFNAISLLVLAYLVGIAVIYLNFPSYRDHVEPTVASNSLLVAAGQPIYAAVDSPNRMSILYGPATFYLGALLSKFFSDPIFASKLAGVIQGLGTLVIFASCLLRRFPLRHVLWASGFVALVMLLFTHRSFWNRPDSLLLLASGLACGSVTVRSRGLSIVMASLAAALAISAKIHGLLYLLPCVPIFVSRNRWQSLFVTGIVAAVLSILPAYLLSSISLANYIDCVLLATKHAFDSQMFIETFGTLVLISVPLLIAIRVRGDKWSTHNKVVLFSFLVSAILVLVLASKQGSGRHQLLPFAPVIGLLTLYFVEGAWPKRTESRENTRYAFVLLVLVASLSASALIINGQKRVIRYLLNESISDARAELESFIDKHKEKRIAMGYSGRESYRLTFLKPLVVMQTRENFVDAAAIMDMQLSGLKIPSATIEKVQARVYDVFLLPIGGEPFSLDSSYHRGLSLFGEALQSAFAHSYKQVDSGEFFAVWQAKQSH